VLEKKIIRKALPARIRRTIRHAIVAWGKWRTNWYLAWLRWRVWPQGAGQTRRCFGYRVRLTDGPNFYMQYKDEFIRRIYHFEAPRPDPLIIDGGSNIGMSILYFKHAYPQSRIIGFEPDPAIFGLLQENVTANRLHNVTLINAGLDGQAGTVSFVPDGSVGGHIGDAGHGVTVRMEQLSNYLTEPVDFLKLNIEGAELPVLQEAAAGGKLRNIRELVIEYHGWARGEQRLGNLLNLLDNQGFRYLVHDFDAESCGTSKPPFHLTPETTWFCLVYARRLAKS
jgi:FkbM family methyltransferase